MAARQFRFAHMADAHVGAWSRDPGLRRGLLTSVLEALETVRRERCEFLLLSGDTFHTPVPDPSEAAPLARAFRSLQADGIRIYAIFGSHDYLFGRTSWLDVLSEGGLFQRVAGEEPPQEGTRWTLPFLRDGPTGAVLAGVSGRAQGLDRRAFDDMDPSDFTAQRGTRIFLFHAAVEEFLPPHLRGYVPGVPQDLLPEGCAYYAGGHIHVTYEGKGPGGGPLVNPGAVFGTSRTDLANVAQGSTRAGVVIVDVVDGRAVPRWHVTTRADRFRVLDIDVDGLSASEALARIRTEMEDLRPQGAHLLPRVRGLLRQGTFQDLDLGSVEKDLRREGATSVRFDVNELTTPSEGPGAPGEDPGVPTDGEARILQALTRAISGTDVPPEFQGEKGLSRARELLVSLGIPPAEGEARTDYVEKRLEIALRWVGIEVPAGSPGNALRSPEDSPPAHRRGRLP